MNTKSKIALTLVIGVAIGAAAMQGLHAQAKPKAYLVTESEVLDAAALASYTAAIGAVQKAAGGRSLAPGERLLQSSARHLNDLVSANGIVWSRRRHTSTPQRARTLWKVRRSSKSTVNISSKPGISLGSQMYRRTLAPGKGNCATKAASVGGLSFQTKHAMSLLAHRDKSQSPEFTVGIDAERTFVDKRSRPNLQQMTQSGH